MEISKFLKKKTLIVCNDSGAGYQIYYFLKTKKKKSFSFYLKGPSKRIFKRLNSYNSLKKAIMHSDTILTGTGWQTDTEYSAIKYAFELKKRVISFVDAPHNINFRFDRKGKSYFPNVIVTKDRLSYRKVKQVVPRSTRVLKTKDYYLDYVKKNRIKPKNNRIIYLSSNFDNILSKLKKRKFNYDISLLSFFIKKIKKIKKFQNLQIFLKLHPSEKAKKYENSKIFRSLQIKLTKENNLLNCLKNFRYVFGCETFALVVAKYYGLDVYNNIKGINKLYIKPILSREYKIKKI
ncbi:hypothetical protein [Candidatus Pelagibacter communis]|mgnify:CR=1 FL=1|uniref:hypothetical protein n=1 Tax=Pelagibacter ubique TaxID=198252 RepID=UPI00094CDEF0|nr:hypothetical protein [Candidatus Pelagibacter ubique]|tara:strand:+ start:308 stop:1183 length:876 start_codon:yes stop_codon:yes gene_type:complete